MTKSTAARGFQYCDFWNVSVIHFERGHDRHEVLRVEAPSSGSAIKAAAERLHEDFNMDYIIRRVEGPYT